MAPSRSSTAPQLRNRVGLRRCNYAIAAGAIRALVPRFTAVVRGMIERVLIEIREPAAGDWDSAPPLITAEVNALLADPRIWLWSAEGDNRMVMTMTTDLSCPVEVGSCGRVDRAERESAAVAVGLGDRMQVRRMPGLARASGSAGRVLVDSRALIEAIFGAVIGAAVAYWVVKRQWWRASAMSAFGTVVLLGIVTEGNRSRPERNVVRAVELVLLGYFAVAARAGMRARRRDNL